MSGAGEALFEEYVVAFLKDITAVLVPGSSVAVVVAKHAGRVMARQVGGREGVGFELAARAGRALFRVLGRGDEPERQRRMDAFAGVTPREAEAVVERYVRNTPFSEEDKDLIARYLSASSMSARQALRRWNDNDRVTTLISQLPRSPEDAARLAPIRPPRFRVGYRIAGSDLCLDMFLGQGGFAEVWRARNTEFPSYPPVALKFCLDRELMPSLKREVELLTRLEGYDGDKDFVRLLYTAYSADPPYLAYEYIDGGNIEGWMQSFAGRAPPIADVLAVLKMVARAVALAHAKGIVHRDLKPSNLLVTRKGRVKLADFGVGHATVDLQARRAKEGAAAREPAERAHTPMYADDMRDPLAPPDPRDDVYAIGVIGFQLLVGRTVRPGAAWDKHLAMRGMPRPLITALEHCVAPPGERFRDAGALLAALEDLSAAEPARAAPDAPRPQQRFCHECGAPAAGLAYCHNCGHRLPAQ